VKDKDTQYIAEKTKLCYTSEIRFWSSSVSLGKSLRAISICKPTMYSLQMSISCCAYRHNYYKHIYLLCLVLESTIFTREELAAHSCAFNCRGNVVVVWTTNYKWL